MGFVQGGVLPEQACVVDLGGLIVRTAALENHRPRPATPQQSSSAPRSCTHVPWSPVEERKLIADALGVHEGEDVPRVLEQVRLCHKRSDPPDTGSKRDPTRCLRVCDARASRCSVGGWMGATHVGDPELEVALVVAVLLNGVLAKRTQALLIDLLQSRRVASRFHCSLRPLDVAVKGPT